MYPRLNPKYNTCAIYLAGLSIIKDGKIPYFLNDDMWKTVFEDGLLQAGRQQLRLGFQKVGIHQVIG